MITAYKKPDDTTVNIEDITDETQASQAGTSLDKDGKVIVPSSWKPFQAKTMDGTIVTLEELRVEGSDGAQSQGTFKTEVPYDN